MRPLRRRPERNDHAALGETAYEPMRAGTALKILAHLAALAGLCLAFSGTMFLGLQVAPFYGDIGIGVTVALAALYVYFGFIRK